MKQFLTICLATAMLGASLNVDAKVSLKQAMEMQREGKAVAVNSPVKVRNNRALKQLRNVPAAASRFEKVKMQSADQNQKMMKTPGKVNAQGDNIYGYLCYSASLQQGLYEFLDEGQQCVWNDDLYATEYLTPSGLALEDGVLKGYIADIFWGDLFGVYYVELDFETGEILSLESSDEDLNNVNFMQVVALDSDSGTFYGYGAYEGNYSLLSAPADDPLNFTQIAMDGNICMSMCYNSTDGQLYGVTLDYDFVTIDPASGEKTVLSHLDVVDGATYLTGLVYDPQSDNFYWNINTNGGGSYMATINGSTYALDIYEELYEEEEFVSLVTTDQMLDPNQPGRPEAGEVDFYKNNLIGFVYFTLPSTMADGTPIPAGTEVKYETYLDGQIYSYGSGKAGAEVKANFAVPEDGMYKFGLKAVINGVASTAASVRAYVGNDEPLAPANVTITANEISWDAVGGVGVHGGYVDASKIEYYVYLNDSFVARTAETSQAINIDTEAELASYTAVVYALCNKKLSAPAYSNTIIEGAAYKLPVEFEPTAEQFELFKTIDGNGDGKTWTFANLYDGTTAVYSGWDANMALDEWMFLPAISIEDVTKFYTFSMDAAIRNTYYPDEYVEVLICNEPSPRGVVGTIIDAFSPMSTTYEHVSALFSVRQEGEYYIAIHCTSDPDQYGIYVKNFSVEDNCITRQSPEAVDDIELTAFEQGVLKANVEFTMPTKTLGDADIDADAELVATVACGDKQTTVSGKPGEKVSAIIETVQGDNQINVTVALGEFNSPVASETVYTGVDYPGEIENLEYTISADNQTISMTWDPVTEGFNGGYINPETITYDIYMHDGWSWVLYESGITETEYEFTADVQDEYILGVLAHNEAGINGYLSYIDAIAGPSYALPIDEDFADPENPFNTNPWFIYSYPDAEKASFGLSYVSDLGLGEEYADSEDIVIVAQGPAGAKGALATPYFSTVGMNNAALTLDISADFFLPIVSIIAEAGDDAEDIGEIVLDAESGFHKVSVELPEKFLNKEVVRLYIVCEFEGGYEALVINSIEIGATSSVSTLASEGVKIAAGKNVINVSGLNGNNVIVSTLDGRVAAKAEKVSNAASFSVEKGIYVVKAGDKKAKVVVK